jgi:hypothetical protein
MRGTVTRGDKSVSLFDGRDFLGRIVQRDGQFVAFDAQGKQLGSYPTQAAASHAISGAMIKQLECDFAWSQHGR